GQALPNHGLLLIAVGINNERRHLRVAHVADAGRDWLEALVRGDRRRDRRRWVVGSRSHRLLHSGGYLATYNLARRSVTAAASRSRQRASSKRTVCLPIARAASFRPS